MGAIADVLGGGTPSTSDESLWNGAIPWITSADINGIRSIEPRKRVTEVALKRSATNLVPAGSIIVVTRVGLGKVALAPTPLCFSQDSHGLVFDRSEIHDVYLVHFLKQAVQIFKHQSRGTTISGVTKKQLVDLPVRLPPLAEQRRIVAEIDTQFTRLDAAVAALRRARANLKRYRASVLKAACEGRLVPTEAELARREGREWKTVKLEELLSQPLANGRSVPDGANGFPVLRLTAIKKGRVDLTERKLGAWTREAAQAYLVRRGDFLVARGNGSLSLVGRGGLLDIEPDEVAYPDTLIRVRVDEQRILPTFLRLVWESDGVRSQIESTARTTAGIYKINQQHLHSFVLPLPSLGEQRLVVADVERRLSVTEALEATVTAALQRAERLRQSILKRAFEGKLVPQDPNNEPAGALLERIRSERTIVNGQSGRLGKRLPSFQPKLEL